MVANRLKSGLGPPTFAQDLGRHLFAGPASGRDAQLALEPPQILDSGLYSLVDLLVGNRVADADVHDFSAF
jgi:hypothetical protein